MYNSEVTYTQNYVDSYGMMLRQNEPWDTDGDNGRGDSIGRTVLSGIAYGMEKRAFSKIAFCCHDCYDNTFVRHPEIRTNDISRDHMTYYLIIRILAGHAIWHSIPWKLSEKYSQTIDMWLWIKSLSNKWWSIMFYMIEFFIMIGAVIWNRSLRWVAGFKQERTQSQWMWQRDYVGGFTLTYFQIRIRKILYPMYAIHILAWQLYVLPNSIGKKLIHALMRCIVDKENLLVSMLIGRKVSLEQIDAYQPMNSYRWSTRLDETNDRSIHVLSDPKLYEYNAYDRDILFTVYNKLNN